MDFESEFESDEAPEVQELLAASDAAVDREYDHDELPLVDKIEEVEEDEADPPPNTGGNVAQNWSTLGFDDCAVRDAFINALPGPTSEFTFTKELLKKKIGKGQEFVKGTQSRGYTDELYAFDLAYAKWKNDRMPQDPLPTFLYDIIAKLRPDLLKKKKEEKKNEEMAKKRFQKSSLSLGFTQHNGATVHYLLLLGKPVVTNSMCEVLLTTMYKSTADTTGCVGQENLFQGFHRLFSSGQYSTNEARRLAKEIAKSCTVCAGHASLPKKTHPEPIHTMQFGERFQIDASEVAPHSLKRLRQNGYRYLLTIVDCASKKGEAFATKTLTIKETLPLIVKLFKQWMIPDILHSDNGGQFRNKLLEHLKEIEGFEHIFGKAETPQHQGQVKRFNRTLKTMLFKWIRANWGSVADGSWHDEGKSVCLDEYNSRIHQTTRLAPDMYVLGRMKTPTQRREHQDAVRSVNQLLVGRRSLLSRTTMEHQAKEDEFTAAVVSLHLERRDVLHRKALSSTAKAQTANRIRRSGGRISMSAIPQIGQKVFFRRPVRYLKQFKAKNPAAPPNVEGTITAVSTVGFSFCVEWTDEKKNRRQTWLFPSELNIAGGGDSDLPEVTAPPTVLWSDLRMYIKDFSNSVQSSWQNTRALIKQLKAIKIDSAEVEQALGLMDLPDHRTVSASRYCEEATVQVLDSKFWTFLQSNIEHLGDHIQGVKINSLVDQVLAFLVG